MTLVLLALCVAMDINQGRYQLAEPQDKVLDQLKEENARIEFSTNRSTLMYRTDTKILLLIIDMDCSKPIFIDVAKAHICTREEFLDISDNLMDYRAIALLRSGLKPEELPKLFGDGVNVGSGEVVLEWRLNDGRAIQFMPRDKDEASSKTWFVTVIAEDKKSREIIQIGK